tara:strand:- start:1166 stop:2509 length:1344 start_codon:yes stop_codon:yes gene_type:complete
MISNRKKIIFVENRYRTDLWYVIAEYYQKLGHEVHIIFQNLAFDKKNSSFNNHVIKYPSPSAEDLNTEEKKYYEKIIIAHRGINYFGINNYSFIKYYDKKIRKIIDKIQPDFVFGESTLFHELLIIKYCKYKKILYLHPSSSRYPRNRFSFYKYDSLIPYKGSGDKLDKKNALRLVEKISKREVLPDYMNINIKKPKIYDKIYDKILLIKEYYKGEKFNTPSPFRKLYLDFKFKFAIVVFNFFAKKFTQNTKGLNILYPMQMQPEANIDVWGYPNNDQFKIIKDIINNISEKDKLYIKPNPKSKYEIDFRIIKLIKKYPNKVIALKSSVAMNDIIDYIDLVITVTGTISIECIFINKPVLMLGQGIQSFQKNCIRINKISEIRKYLKMINNNIFPKISNHEKITFINELLSSSYQGINGDGLHNRSYLNEEENLNKLKTAYLNIIQN